MKKQERTGKAVEELYKKYAVKRSDMEILAGYRNYLRRHPRLVYLFFELTNRCNMACLHCGSNCSSRESIFLPYEAIVRVMKEVAEAYGTGETMICLTGGEPLLHPDFDRIIRKIDEFGFTWGITTNGTLLSQEKIDVMKQCSIPSITVSLDGVEETNDWFRQRKGAYREILDAIRLAHANNIPVRVTTVVHKKNMDELERVYRLMQEMAVESWRLVSMDPIGRAGLCDALLLCREDYTKLFDFIREKRYRAENGMEVVYGCAHFLGLDYEKELRDYYFICGSGIYVASILCNGDIYSCLDIERRPELIQGNIYEDSFIDVWENRFAQFRQDWTEFCTTCRECGERMICGGDSLHTWDFDKNRPKLCLMDRI